MAKKNEIVKLRGWQQAVIDAIENHEDDRGSEQYQQTPAYAVNRVLGITIHLPPQSGHTFLARYIAETYPSFIVYSDMRHFRELAIEIADANLDTDKSTETISMHEIFYALNKPDVRQPSEELSDLNNRMALKKVIVVDNASKIHQVVKDYLYNTATGVVVMLG